MRYVALDTEVSPVQVIAIGDDLEHSPMRAIKEKIEKRYKKLYGEGQSYRQHYNRVQFLTVEQTMRLYPHLRERLKFYNMEYYEWREKIDAHKSEKLSRRKVGIRFVERA